MVPDSCVGACDVYSLQHKLAIFKSENNETTVVSCGLRNSKDQHCIAYAAHLEQRAKDN